MMTVIDWTITMVDDLADIEDAIEAALPSEELVSEFHERLDETKDDEAYIGVLLRMCWMAKGAPILAGRLYDAIESKT
jgi:hypothetical protein